MILLNSYRPLKRLSLTSGLSSRRRLRNTPTICSLVLNFPIMGQRKRILSARAAKYIINKNYFNKNLHLTYKKLSVDIGFNKQHIFFTISSGCINLQKLASLETAADLTSLSLSYKNFT